MNAIFTPHYDAADAETRNDGRLWYPNANAIARQWADKYALPVESVCGIIAALSQRTRWRDNLERARACLRGERPYGLGLAADKAIAIRKGAHPLDVLGAKAPKVTAFYRAIMGDMQAVVLDTWMLYVAAEAGYNMGWMTLARYERLAYILQCEAESVGLNPATFQAVVWCQVRNTGG